MATTLTASTLKVTVKEEITLGGVKYDFKKEKSISNVNQIYHRIVRVGTSSQSLLNWDSDNDVLAGGLGKIANTKYVRITNLDSENYVTLKIAAANTKYEHRLLEAGRTIIFNHLGSEQDASWAAWDAFEYIHATANTAAVDLEVFVASAQTFTADDQSG
jgi:hypothetical protein